MHLRIITTGPFLTQLGGLNDFTMQPAAYPLCFTNATTAVFRGEALVSSGDPVGLTIDYTAEQLFNPAMNTAAVATGDGALPGPIALEDILRCTGGFRGRMAFDFGGRQVTTPQFTLGLVSDPTSFYSIEYPDGPGGLDAPVLGYPEPQVMVWAVSQLYDQLPIPEEAEILESAAFCHSAAVLVEENNYTRTHGPNQLVADVYSYDSQGAVLDSIIGLVLERVQEDDGDPAHVIYASDLYRPILIADTQFNETEYPNLLFLSQDGDPGGSLRIVPRLFQNGGGQ